MNENKNLEALTAEMYKDLMTWYKDFMNKSGALDIMIKNCTSEEFEFIRDSLRMMDKIIDMEVAKSKRLDEIDRKLDQLLKK